MILPIGQQFSITCLISGVYFQGANYPETVIMHIVFIKTFTCNTERQPNANTHICTHACAHTYHTHEISPQKPHGKYVVFNKLWTVGHNFENIKIAL